MRVALVVMPFAASDRPSLAAGLLQAGLRRVGIACETKYFNLTLAGLLGAETYDFLSSAAPMTALAGEWAFSQAFYGSSHSSWPTYRAEVLRDPIWGMAERDEPRVEELLSLVPLFLRLSFESTDWSRYHLVGFTSTFQQTMPSLALARMIKAAHPDVSIAVGGANFEGEMGAPYLDHYPFLDFVATAEADDSFPRLCRRFADALEGGEPTFVVPPGILHRHGPSRTSRPTPTDLEGLSTPDYSDYFGAASRGGATPRWLPIEAARGCWWGARAHCTFCGLNGETMAFRAKSWQRVAREVDELVGLYGDLPLQFADNILGMSYFQDLLPHWADRGHGVPKFVELKSNLRRSQVELLRAAGVTSVQAGVESLSDDTLRLMRKGVSGAQNLALLRWCVELGIDPLWNVLYGFPGERLEEYRSQLELFEKIVHLPPPSVFAPIRMDRFSPNFTAWAEMGFTERAPMPAYRHVFPLPAADLERLAYYFRYTHPQMDAALREGRSFQHLGHRWNELWRDGRAGRLALEHRPGNGYEVVDSRGLGGRGSRRPTVAELALLAACDSPTTARRAFAVTRSHGTAESDLRRLVDHGLVARVGGRLVTLALLPDRGRLGNHLERMGGRPVAVP